jgi:predicted kinase
LNHAPESPDPCPSAPGFNLDTVAVEAFVGHVVPVSQMANTPQDPRHHAEGDVWTHTRLVTESLAADPDWRALAEPVRRIAFTAALLHDVGKPSTTREEDGRLTSRGHSRRGETLARVALWRLGTPFAEREHICRLIRHHQIPFFALERVDADLLAQRLSLVLRHDALALLARADARGRCCREPGERVRLEDATLLWREFCSELGILNGPRRFASPHTRAVWLEDIAAHGHTTRHPDVQAHDDTTAEVILMSGLPGSGKDTWLRNHHPDLPVVSLDEIRAHLGLAPGETNGRVISAARDMARGYLRVGSPFAWNATNLSDQLRTQVSRLCRDYRARVSIVYVETGAEEQARRNRERSRPVPAAAVARMLARWTVPAPDEAHGVTYVIDGQPAGEGWPP